MSYSMTMAGLGAAPGVAGPVLTYDLYHHIGAGDELLGQVVSTFQMRPVEAALWAQNFAAQQNAAWYGQDADWPPPQQGDWHVGGTMSDGSPWGYRLRARYGRRV